MPYANYSGRVKAIFRAVAVLALVAGCSGSTETNERRETASSRQAPIAGGVADLVHTSVFAQYARGNDNTAGLCTGTLILPNLILTARHCVSDHPDTTVVCGQAPLDELIPAQNIAVTNDPHIESATRWFGGQTLEVPPQGDDTCGFDVALLILDTNVPSSVAEPYVPRIDRLVEAGEPYIAVGYGLTSNNTSGERQQRSGLSIQCAPGTCGGAVRSREFVGETGICSGDSGGPALDTDGKVIGVVSRGSGTCESPVYTAVSQWRDWLLEVAGRAVAAGGYPAPFWVTTGRSDPPASGTGGGAGSGGTSPAGGTSGEGGTSGGGPSTSGGSAGVVGPGMACGAPAPCTAGYACYYASDPTDAVCTPRCETGCSDGTSCNARLGVCTKPDSDDGGCAVGAAGSARRDARAALWLSLVGLVLAYRRRALHA